MNVKRSALMASATFFLISTLISFADNADSLVPVGPPTDPRTRMKTLNEIEPREAITQLPYPVITNSGAYYLTKNLTNSAPGDGIVINADDVKLDLNGFALIGGLGSSNGVKVVGGARHNINIRNGVVRGWGICGVDAASAHESIMEGLTVFTNKADGLKIGDNAQVRNCGAFKNNGNGIVAGSDTTITDCKARDSVLHGINAGVASKVTDCTAAHNGVGNAGIMVSDYCTVRNCTTVGNQGDGIRATSQCRIVGNNSGNNTSSGIRVLGSNNRIEDNNVVNNNTGNTSFAGGIYIEDTGRGNLVTRNSATGNGISPPLDYRSIPGGDYFGFIVNSSEMKNAGGGFTNTNPWANFRF